MTGTVKKIQHDKGFGFILANGKSYFFHRSAVKNAKFDSIEEGDEVTFEDSESDKGPRADDVYVS